MPQYRGVRAHAARPGRLLGARRPAGRGRGGAGARLRARSDEPVRGDQPVRGAVPARRIRARPLLRAPRQLAARASPTRRRCGWPRGSRTSSAIARARPSSAPSCAIASRTRARPRPTHGARSMSDGSGHGGRPGCRAERGPAAARGARAPGPAHRRARGVDQGDAEEARAARGRPLRRAARRDLRARPRADRLPRAQDRLRRRPAPAAAGRRLPPRAGRRGPERAVSRAAGRAGPARRRRLRVRLGVLADDAHPRRRRGRVLPAAAPGSTGSAGAASSPRRPARAAPRAARGQRDDGAGAGAAARPRRSDATPLPALAGVVAPTGADEPTPAGRRGHRRAGRRHPGAHVGAVVDRGHRRARPRLAVAPGPARRSARPRRRGAVSRPRRQRARERSSAFAVNRSSSRRRATTSPASS